jgi:hypothetical protein
MANWLSLTTGSGERTTVSWICPLAATKKTPRSSQNVTGFTSQRTATLPLPARSDENARLAGWFPGSYVAGFGTGFCQSGTGSRAARAWLSRGADARAVLTARRRKRRKASVRPGNGWWRAPDRVKRKFGAGWINRRRCGHGTEIVTGEGKLYLVMNIATGKCRGRHRRLTNWVMPRRSLLRASQGREVR